MAAAVGEVANVVTAAESAVTVAPTVGVSVAAVTASAMAVAKRGAKPPPKA